MTAPRSASALALTALALALGQLAPGNAAAAGEPAQSAEGAPAAAGAPAPGDGSATPAAPSASPVAVQALSNERTVTTWAHPLEAISVFAHPDLRSPRVGHMRMETEDGFPEVYLLLASRTDTRGQQWVKLRIPGRPNGRRGWVLRSALGAFHRTRWLIVIRLDRRTLTAYYDGHRRFRAPVGVGKPSSPTPPGRFWIRERFRVSDRSNPYWPYALGTSDYSTLTDWPGGGVVGIHGDFGQPQLIPGDPSHGCVRMRAADIAWLAPRVTLGTPVRIE
jgi:hypothetical protein